MGLFNFFMEEIAIDLGTANTLIIHNDKVVVDQPSIVAIDRRTDKVIAVGQRAMQMHEKTHANIKTIRPLKDGVIADFYAAENMIREMIKMIFDKKKNIFPPRFRMSYASLRASLRWRNVPSRIAQSRQEARKSR